MKTITLKLTLGGRRIGPFTVTDDYGNIIATNVPKDVLINGVSYIVNDNVSILTIQSIGLCTSIKSININHAISSVEVANAGFVENNAPSLWRHLTNKELYNSYYGGTYPYVLEYPFATQQQDEILQNIKDYSKVFKYFNNNTGVFNNYEKVELDDAYFNKLIVYNGQQNSGLLELVKKPKNNLSQYNTYPIYRESSKVITYTKSDNFYNINTFWDCTKERSIPQFITDCNNLSMDKSLNQSNMDYSKRSFNKSPLRAKETKVRYILDNRSDIHIRSQILYSDNQISYK